MWKARPEAAAGRRDGARRARVSQCVSRLVEVLESETECGYSCAGARRGETSYVALGLGSAFRTLQHAGRVSARNLAGCVESGVEGVAHVSCCRCERRCLRAPERGSLFCIGSLPLSRGGAGGFVLPLVRGRLANFTPVRCQFTADESSQFSSEASSALSSNERFTCAECSETLGDSFCARHAVIGPISGVAARNCRRSINADCCSTGSACHDPCHGVWGASNECNIGA